MSTQISRQQIVFMPPGVLAAMMLDSTGIQCENRRVEGQENVLALIGNGRKHE
jgi:hypothetical protein